MLRIGIIVVLSLIVATLATTWLVVVAASRSNAATTGLMFGYARGEQWVVNAAVCPDGSIVLQHFSPNLSAPSGPFARFTTQRIHTDRWIWRPRIGNDRISSYVVYHLLVPLLVPLVLLGVITIPPWLRRRHRRRTNRCLACGYDLRGSTGERCPECGTPMRVGA